MDQQTLKTELTAGSDPVHFRVAVYNSKYYEFDTLDGVQIGWYLCNKIVFKERLINRQTK